MKKLEALFALRFPIGAHVGGSATSSAIAAPTHKDPHHQKLVETLRDT